MKINEGEIPKFHVENSHPAIVTPLQYDLVQAEWERRERTAGKAQTGLSPYSCKLICESCGSYLGPKTWHSTSPYRRVVWQCNRKYAGAEVCQTTHVKEEEIQRAFISAFNSLISDRTAMYAHHHAMMKELTNTADLDRRIAKYIAECDVVAGLIRKAVEESASTAVDPDEYETRYNALVARFEAAREKHEAAAREKRFRELRRVQAAAFFVEVEQRDGFLAVFDEELWNCTIESMTVLVGGGFRARFKDGVEVEVISK